jgi:hypothetical protein
MSRYIASVWAAESAESGSVFAWSTPAERFRVGDREMPGKHTAAIPRRVPAGDLPAMLNAEPLTYRYQGYVLIKEK